MVPFVAAEAVDGFVRDDTVCIFSARKFPSLFK